MRLGAKGGLERGKPLAGFTRCVGRRFHVMESGNLGRPKKRRKVDLDDPVVRA